MNLRPFILIALAVCAVRAPAANSAAKPARRDRQAAAAAPVAVRTESSVAPAVSFDSFRLISERNIFNPNRTGRRDRSSEEQAPRLDVISLIGTMESDRGLRAFFYGSETAFRKALKVGDSVEKFKVAQIAPNVVDLEREGKTLAMRVGQQLRRPEGGEWNLISIDIVRSEAAAAAAKEASGRIDPSAPVVIPANADEVTRRLMEKRNKDLKQ